MGCGFYLPSCMCRVFIPSDQLVLISGLLFGAGSSGATATNVSEIIVSDTAFDDGYFYFLDSIGYVVVSFRSSTTVTY